MADDLHQVQAKTAEDAAALAAVIQDPSAFVHENDDGSWTVVCSKDHASALDKALAGMAATRKAAAALPVRRRFSWVGFLDLMTDKEQEALVKTTMTDPKIKLWYDRSMSEGLVNLDDDKIVRGINALVDTKVLTKTRAQQVLSGKGS